jgi:hypothetical protein
MSEPVVLPKFELPGEKPHWAVRAAWISTAVLVVAIGGLVGILMHRHSLEIEAHVRREEAIARVKAEADAKVAAAAAAAKAVKEAELADQHAREAAAAAAKAAALAAKAGETADTDGDGVAKARGAKSSSHRSHSGHGGKGSKSAVKTAGGASSKDSGGGGVKDNSSSLKPKSGKPDPIDDMLRKMK